MTGLSGKVLKVPRAPGYHKVLYITKCMYIGLVQYLVTHYLTVIKLVWYHMVNDYRNIVKDWIIWLVIIWLYNCIYDE